MGQGNDFPMAVQPFYGKMPHTYCGLARRPHVQK